MDPLTYRRFVRDGRGALAPDLYSGVSQLLLSLLSGAQRKAERNRLLREAAAMLGDLPTWTKARQLHEEAKVVNRRIPTDPDLSTVRGLLASAMHADPWKTAHLSVRQIHRLIREH